MKKLVLFVALVCVPLAFAADDRKEVDRVKDAGEVLKEILNIPDDILIIVYCIACNWTRRGYMGFYSRNIPQ